MTVYVPVASVLSLKEVFDEKQPVKTHCVVANIHVTLKNKYQACSFLAFPSERLSDFRLQTLISILIDLNPFFGFTVRKKLAVYHLVH